MRTKIFAYVTISVIITAVVLNTIFLDKKIGEFIEMIDSINVDEPSALDYAESARDEFQSMETYISITVSHDDLTNIEDGFAELVGYLQVGDTDGATVIKNRLLNSLEHLRRLLGINFDAII